MITLRLLIFNYQFNKNFYRLQHFSILTKNTYTPCMPTNKNELLIPNFTQYNLILLLRIVQHGLYKCEGIYLKLFYI